MAQILTEVYIG